MASTSGGSLRDTYSTPPDSWSFVPELSTTASSTSNASGSPNAPWGRPSKIHVFDLTPAPFDDIRTGLLLDDTDGRDWGKMISDFIASAMLAYAGTAVVMPFEVAKTLLQVQWIPKEDIEDVMEPPEVPQILPGDKDEDAMSDTSTSSYFRDPEAYAGAARFEPSPQAKLADEDGYPIHRSTDHLTRPSYIIPAGPSDGVWGMVRRIASWKTEGYLGLWKGQLTATILDTLSSSLQPAVLSLLYTIQTGPDPVPPYSLGTLALPVLSHAITAHLLSPLDLLRTRLICQPSSAPTLSLPVSLLPIAPLAHLISREGGLRATYIHPQLLIPSILDNTIRPLLSLSAPIVIHHYTGLEAESSPVLFGLAELVWSIASLSITLPIETVRRRLQLQSRAVGLENGTQAGWRTAACVETRPTPYVGVVDCVYRILTEERSLPTMRRKRRRFSNKEKEKEGAQAAATANQNWSLMRNTGIGQLYRGFGIGVSAHVLVFILGAVAGERLDRERGWTEL
ncbi:hypothetical protein FRB94_008994 [Tulasnella sp. JGI-2019a]|nr:hypothetical protein FRB94_008994 [Tulasnella sp. JGI-2019a]